MPNFAISTICFGPEADAREVLDFAIRFAEFSQFLHHFRDLISLETRSPVDPHGAVLRSRADIDNLWRS
jgi:hypothetical protein